MADAAGAGSGETVAVSPEALRTMGGDITEARETLEDDNNGNLLGGVGDHRQVSEGSFPPGLQAQSHLTGHVSGIDKALATIQTKMVGLCSAALILADVYDSADHEEALRFAFAEPGVEAPGGLPMGVDPDSSFLQQQQEEHGEAGDDEETDATELGDAGQLDPGDDNIETRGATGEERAPGALQHLVTERYDDDGNLEWEQHKVTTVDGVEYYTEDHRPDGSVERTNEIEFGYDFYDS